MPDDPELLERALAGEEDAFTSLYRRRQGGVYRFALQMTGSVEVAEDVTQETFLALLTHGSRYDAARGNGLVLPLRHRAQFRDAPLGRMARG